MISPSLPVMLFTVIYFGLLIGLCWIDFQQQRLPDVLTYPLLWSGMVYQSLFAPGFVFSAVLGAIVGYVSLWLLYWFYRFWRAREGIGYGDMKLLAALGVWHGYLSLSWILLIAAGCGLATVGMQSLLQRKNCFAATTRLPFGPCLAIAGSSVGWLNSTLPLSSMVSLLP